jgi:hypothetical protein
VSYIHESPGSQALNLCESLLCDDEDGVLSIDIDEVSEELRVQAVRSWCLLAGLLPAGEVVTRSRERVFVALLGMVLDAGTSSDTKQVAGEALAFCFECASAVSGDAQDAASLGETLCAVPELVQRTLTALQQAARESSRYISKKDRKEQRSAFREIVSYVVDGDAPEESVRFTGADFTARSFRELRLLGDLRRVLSDCFERGLVVYPLVLELIGLDPTEMQEVLSGTQVAKGSDREKRRAAYRKQDRRYKDAFLGDDGSEDA